MKRSKLAILARLASASVTGLATAGMHYTRMAAARFAADARRRGRTAILPLRHLRPSSEIHTPSAFAMTEREDASSCAA